MKENFKYLIRSKDYEGCYLQNKTNFYSSDVGTAIHDELPLWVFERENGNHEVIRSDSPEFTEILRKEIDGTKVPSSGGLLLKIKNLEFQLSTAKNNRDLILQCLEDLGMQE